MKAFVLLGLGLLLTTQQSVGAEEIKRADLSKRLIEVPLKKFVGLETGIKVNAINASEIPGSVVPPRVLADYDFSEKIPMKFDKAGAPFFGTKTVQAGIKESKAISPKGGLYYELPGKKFQEVAPGYVEWQKSFNGAREAAKKSGKPVLLFAMMGSLDKKFC